MARPSDQGAYEVGNVIICRAETNRAQRNHNYPMQGEHNPAFGKDYWASASPSERKRRKEMVSKQMRGKPKSKKQRAAMSKTATGRRRVIRDGHMSWAYLGDADYPYGPDN